MSIFFTLFTTFFAVYGAVFMLFFAHDLFEVYNDTGSIGFNDVLGAIGIGLLFPPYLLWNVITEDLPKLWRSE